MNEALRLGFYLKQAASGGARCSDNNNNSIPSLLIPTNTEHRGHRLIAIKTLSPLTAVPSKMISFVVPDTDKSADLLSTL